VFAIHHTNETSSFLWCDRTWLFPFELECNSLSRGNGRAGRSLWNSAAESLLRWVHCPIWKLSDSVQLVWPSIEANLRLPSTYEGTDTISRVRRNRRPRARTSISSTQETPGTRLPNADSGQSVFSRSRSDDSKRTAAVRASGICQGGLSPFWLNWRLSHTGDRLWLSFQRPRSPKLANGQRRETMS